jgi:hypothetical protein
VVNYFNSDAVGGQVVEQVRLGNGVIWDVGAIKAMVLLPTAGADTLTGYASDDVINGAEGNDVISGQGGDDTLDGGAGLDSLDGGAGDDTLRAGTGDDSMRGDLSNDTYLYDRRGRHYDQQWQFLCRNDRHVTARAGILPANVTLTRSGAPSYPDLRLTFQVEQANHDPILHDRSRIVLTRSASRMLRPSVDMGWRQRR